MKTLLLKLLLLILIAGGPLLFFNHPVFASSCSFLQITELMPNPAAPLADSTDEWVEIHNTSSSRINIGGCGFSDSAGSVRSFVFQPGAEMEPSGYAIFYSRNTRIALNNDQDQLVLFEGANTLSKTDIYKSAPSGESFALLGGKWVWTKSPTPGSKNLIKSSSSTADTSSAPVSQCQSLIVSEIMPDPKSPQTDTLDEWIEVFNKSSNVKNIGGCILTDSLKSGSTKRFIIPNRTAIGGGKFLVFSRRNTKISLNNDGDWVKILGSDGQTVFDMKSSYGKTTAGASYAFDGARWYWTSRPTPGDRNIIAAISKTEKQTPGSSKTKTTKWSGEAESTAGVLGEVVGTEDDQGGKAPNFEETKAKAEVGNSFFGYGLITLSILVFFGYILWVKKGFFYENYFQKSGRDDKNRKRSRQGSQRK